MAMTHESSGCTSGQLNKPKASSDWNELHWGLRAFVGLISLLFLGLVLAILIGGGPYTISGDLTVEKNRGKIDWVVKQDPQLKLLFDYTLWHIGLYVTLTTGILAVLYKTSSKRDLLFLVPIIFFVGAGMCGGIIGSNIPSYATYSARHLTIIGMSKDHKGPVETPFLEGQYKVFFSNPKTYKEWIQLEHELFWAGVLLMVLFVGLQILISKNGKGDQTEITLKPNSTLTIKVSQPKPPTG